MRTIRLIALIVLIVGGVNWGLVGLANFNLVEAIFGTLSRLIYFVVGLAAIYAVFDLIATDGQRAGTVSSRRDL